MTKLYPIILLLILINFSAQSQNPPIQLNWLNSAQEYYNGGDFIATDATALSDGSTVVTGYFKNTVDFDPGSDTFTVSTKFQFDMFLARYSNKGKLIFAFGLNGTGNLPFVNAETLTEDADDNIYVTGNIEGDIDFDPGTGKTILSSASGAGNFIACYTKQGELKFAKTFSAGKTNSIALDKNKNIFITGSFEGYDVDFDPGINNTHTSADASDIFFAKYDSACNFKFVKTLSGRKYDNAAKIALDKNNNIIICGNFSSPNLDADPDSTKKYILTLEGDADLFFAKYDTSGKLIFAKNIGNYGTNSANGLAVGTDNNFVLTGKFNGVLVDFDPANPGTHLLTSQNDDVFIAKYDANGNCVFAFAIGNTGSYDQGIAIDLDKNNNIFCTGEFGGKSVDFDPGTGIYNIATSKKGYYYLAKYTYAGNIVSAVAIGGQFPDNYTSDFEINSLHVTQTGKTIIAGYFHDDVDFDARVNTAIVNEPTNSMFICKYDNANNFIAEINGNNYHSYLSNTAVKSSAIDKAGNVYVCGTFTGRFDFDPGPGKYILDSYADSIYSYYNNAGFFAKYTANGKFLFAKAIKGGETKTTDIAVDDNENIYVAGTATPYTDFDPGNGVRYVNNAPIDSNFYYIFYFARYDANGNLIFAKGNGSYSNFLEVNCLAIDNKKNICIGGRFSDTLDFDPGINKHILNAGGSANMFLAKYDALGNYFFADCIKSNETPFGSGVIHDLKFDNKFDIVFSGTFHGPNFDFDAGTGEFLLSSINSKDAGFICKYKNNGAFISVIPIYNREASFVYYDQLTTDNSGNIYLAGSCNQEADFDPGTGTAHLSQFHEMFFASYTNKLQFKFLKGLVGYGDFIDDNNLGSIATDKYKNIYVAGRFTSFKIDCDPGPDTALLINVKYGSYYTSNLFIARYDSNGNYIYSNQFKNDSAGSGSVSASILVDDNGTLYYSGFTNGKVNFATGNKKVYLQPTSNYTNMFLTQYRQSDFQLDTSNIASAAKTIINKTIKVYPNPIKDQVNIRLNNITQNNSIATISLFDMNGKCLQINQLSFNNHNLNTNIKLPQNLSAGNYFITIDVEGKTYYSNALIK